MVKQSTQTQLQIQKKTSSKVQDDLKHLKLHDKLNQNSKITNNFEEFEKTFNQHDDNTPPASVLLPQSNSKKVKYIPIGGIIPQGVEKPQIILLKHSEYVDFKKVHVHDPITCDCDVQQKGDCIHNHHCDLQIYNIECPRGSHYDEDGHEIDCGNQKCQRCQYVKNEVRYCGMKGFGLFATQKVKKGQFVIEYVGEILSREHILERITSQSFYAMHLQGKQYLDATYKGNQSRFINHSHDPNLEIRKVYVNDEIHMCMFALRDIKENEEFTFDYQLEYVGGPSIKCLCGAKNCTGYLLKNPND